MVLTYYQAFDPCPACVTSLLASRAVAELRARATIYFVEAAFLVASFDYIKVLFKQPSATHYALPP